MPKSEKKEIQNVEIAAIIVAVFVLTLILFVVYTDFSFIGNAVSEEENLQDDFSFYSEDSCKCLEKQKPECDMKGFEYNLERKLCVNSEEKKVTYPILRCSVYNCSGVVYKFDLETNKWGQENNGNEDTGLDT